MPIRRTNACFKWALIASMSIGCHGANKPLHYLGDKPLDYYKDVATQIDYPAVCTPECEQAHYTDEPRTLLDRQRDEVWNLTLVEALHTALANNRIIRSDAQFMSSGNSLLSNPNFASSIYDPAIQESGVLFAGRGVEAALADFDTNFTTSVLWGRDEQIQNNLFFGGGLTPGNTLSLDTAAFAAELSKRFAYGGTFSVVHDWDYLGTNSPGTLFPSSYSGGLEARYRQPLWAASGTEFTRIAGPINPQFNAITGVSQGVVIARINNDISLADFEASVRNLLRETENLYWDLYLAYRLYDTAIVARNSAIRTWREAKFKLDVGGIGDFKPADEAQARDRLFETRAAAETALTQIYTTEVRLRRLLGLPVNDGRIIRPSDEPTVARFIPEWRTSLVEALTRRVELRRQKWNIKSLELQLKAAKSLTNPRLDVVSSYRVNAFGDTLLSQNDNDGVTAMGLNSAYERLTQGDETGWSAGLEFSMPIGFRSARAQVRNYELRLAKARELLAVQELDIHHELATAFQILASQYQTAQSNFNRQNAAKLRVQLFEAEMEEGTATLDLVLRAQASLADAERAYYSSLVDYSKAIAELHYRKGTLLEHNNVFLAEDGWTHEAYEEALRRAWARTYAFDNKCLHTEPTEFALPGRVGLDACEPGEVPGAANVDVLPSESVPPEPEPLPMGYESSLPDGEAPEAAIPLRTLLAPQPIDPSEDLQPGVAPAHAFEPLSAPSLPGR